MNKVVKRFLSAILGLSVIFGNNFKASTISATQKAAAIGIPSLFAIAAAAIAGDAYSNRKLSVVMIGGDYQIQGELQQKLRDNATDLGGKNCGITDVIQKMLITGHTINEYDTDAIAPRRVSFYNWAIHRIYENEKTHIVDDTEENRKLISKADLVIMIITGDNEAESVYKLFDECARYTGNTKKRYKAVAVQFVCEDKFETLKDELKGRFDTTLKSNTPEGGPTEDYHHLNAYINARTEQPIYSTHAQEGNLAIYESLLHTFYWNRNPVPFQFVSKYEASKEIENEGC